VSYLEKLLAARDAILDGILAMGGGAILEGYSLDGQSESLGNLFDKLWKLEDLILREQNRVSGRREMRVVVGRRWVPYR
jgi:hypothetical protein